MGPTIQSPNLSTTDTEHRNTTHKMCMAAATLQNVHSTHTHTHRETEEDKDENDYDEE